MAKFSAKMYHSLLDNIKTVFADKKYINRLCGDGESLDFLDVSIVDDNGKSVDCTLQFVQDDEFNDEPTAKVYLTIYGYLNSTPIVSDYRLMSFEDINNYFDDKALKKILCA
ncbi:MAG: hypothetical protein II939_03375 [Bacteroidales bacterium]|nr:hypothetical protein [Bacteroidales bacterium]